jgi:hypothetical protein
LTENRNWETLSTRFSVNDRLEDDMRVKSFCSVMLAMASLAFGARAFADDAAAAPPPAPSETPPPTATATGPAAGATESKMRVGLNIVPMPFLGKVSTSLGGQSSSQDLGFAFGVTPVFDYAITPNFFVGVGPTLTFNVKAKDAMGDAAKEYDLLLRVGGQLPVMDKLNVYGYAAPGYSIVSPPQGNSAKGLVVGLHVGAMYDVTPMFFVNGQLGYQLGFQSTDIGGTSADTKFSYFQIGLGGGVHL